MRKIILLLLISISAYCQTYSVVSSTNLGGNGTDDINKAIKISDGNIVLIGATTSNTGDFATNHGGKDIFIRKISLSGSILWTKLYGGSADDEGVDIVEESNGDLTFIANFNSSDGDISIPANYGLQTPGYWVCRINSNASSITSQTQSFSINNYSGSSAKIYAFAKSATGDNIIINRPSSPYNSYSSYNNIVTFNGSNIINALYGSTTFNKMIRLSNGDYVAIGNLSGFAENNGQPYGSNINTSTPGKSDIYVTRLTSTGTVVWKKFFGGTNCDFGVDIKEYNNNLYLVGNTTSNDFDLSSNAGSTDIYLAKLDLDGNKIASSTFASPDPDIVNTLKISTTGTLLMGGLRGGNKLQFIEYDMNLNILRQFESFNPFNGYAIRDIIEIDNDIYFLSETSQRRAVDCSISYGSTVGSDVYLLKYSQCTPPTVTITPTTQTITLGQSATYTATFTGTPPFNLSKPDGSIGVLINSNTYNFNWTPTTTGTFNFIPTVTTCGNVQGNQITLIVNNAPPISIGTISPTSLCYGSNISVPFTSTLPSGTIYTVKLKKGTTTYNTVTGTTSPINIQVPYSSSIVYGTDYFVEVSAGANVSSPSNALVIGAIYGASLYDALGNYYYGSTICNGSSVTILARGTGYAGVAATNILTYRWYKNNVLLPSETNSTLLVNSAGSYYAVVSQGSCSYSTNMASISFSNAIYAYNNYYGDPVACEGTTKKIEANFISNQATYQWYKDNVLISGATNKVYDASSSGLYNVKVIDGTCITFSSPTRLSFLNGSPVNISATNNDTTICGNQSKYLQMNNVDYYNSTYQYQWQKNGVDVVGANQYYYYANQVGKYRLKVTQGGCSSYSKEREIIQSNTSQKPSITAPYTSICNGTLNLQSGVAGGTWYKDGITTNYSGPSYNVSNTGLYKQVVLIGTSCQNESNPVSIRIGQLDKPQIKYVGSTNICGSSDNVFLYADNLNISGTINRQWKKDGVNLSGQVYNSLYAYLPGTYTLVFTNGTCSIESDPIVVTQTSPVMKIVNTDNTLFCSNRAVKLSIDGLGYNTTYSNNKAWYKDGVLIPNETSSDIYVTAAGVYTASINSNGCVGTSAPYEIKSGPPTGFYVGAFDTVPAGQSVTLNIISCSGTVKWYSEQNTGTLLGSNSTFTTPLLNQNTNYWVSCTKEYCESPRTQILVYVSNPCPTEILHSGIVASQEYLTSGRIESTTNLPTGVKYSAKTHIMLSPGFQVGGDEVFEAIIGGCVSTPVIPTNGLILHLPCDGDANDASGNGNNGNVSGAILGIDRFGVANKAYRFSEGNNITIPNSSSLALTDAFTYSVWVNMQSTLGKDGYGQDSNTPQQCIFTKNCDYGQLRSSINPQSDGSFILQTYANDGDQATIPFQLNQWKHIVSTYDGTTLKQFVNGNLVSTKTVTLNLATSNDYNLIIGNMGCYVYYFNGFIDEFRMYNRGLSNAEVLNIYNAEKP